LRPSSKAVCDRPYSRQRRPKYSQEQLGEIARALSKDWGGLANEIWWWNSNVSISQRSSLKMFKRYKPEVFQAMTIPLKGLPTLVGSDKEYVSIIVEARLKMGV